MIRIKNWSKFQHYKDRNPPWIKLATDTFQNYEFSCLQDACKLLAICIWTLGARSKAGEVPNDLPWIRSQCGLGDLIGSKHLKELEEHGFIEIDSKPLAARKQSACLEGEGEGEGETDTGQNEFDRWWSVYPKKVKKGEAKRIWAQKKLKPKYEDLISDVQNRLKNCRRWGDGYIPDPTTYLRGERWTDEIDLGKPARESLVAKAQRMSLSAKPGESQFDFDTRVRDA